MSSEKVPFPEASDEAETSDAYRLRLRKWFDAQATQDDPNDTWRKAEWKHLCDLQGIGPGNY